jgi:NitT/TauT family transport system ATP-binding protein
MDIAVDKVAVTYEGDGDDDLPALGPVTFHIESGGFVTLVGPSGSGKSTLIRALAGLQKPNRGEIRIGGRRVEGAPRGVAMMFQDANLMPWRTVVENIALPLELRGASAAEREAAAARLLPLLGLQGFGAVYPAALSGGMAQRAALGRVLIQQPEILLLDEPFGALDAMTREQISLDLLRIWGEARPTILMVTHDINEAVLLADRVIVLSRRPGQVAADVLVDLPRPRSLDLIYTDIFGDTARRVRAAISR